MESERPSQCSLHGAGASAPSLVGKRLAKVVASWRLYGTDDPAGPLDVWLIDESDRTIHLTTGSDWCLVVETSEPYAGYDMGDSGLVIVGALDGTTPFAEHIGECVLAAREDFEPETGRVAVELSFPSGRVRCESRAGDLRLTRRC